MLRITLAVMTLILLLACSGCRGKVTNVGPGFMADRGPIIGTVTITSATTMEEGETATITVHWTSGTAPYAIAITVEDGLTVPAGTPTGTSPFTRDFTLPSRGTYSWTATITDADGYTGTVSGTYTVVGPMPPNDPPVIEEVDFDENLGTLDVRVSDPDRDDVTVQVSDVDGFIVEQTRFDIENGNGDVRFQWYLSNALDTDVNGTTTISVYDERYRNSPVTATQMIQLVLNSGDTRTLSAVFLQDTAAVGETVTVLISTSSFPADEAFNYMNGIAVTVEDGGDFVDYSFNIGSVGGTRQEVDGIWATMSPAPEYFFLPQDFMMKATDVTADSSLDFMGFNITPFQSGSTTSSGGDLFNFGMVFDHPGVYHLGFLEWQDVKRTYYSDDSANEYNWEDIDNFHGVPNFITVTEE